MFYIHYYFLITLIGRISITHYWGHFQQKFRWIMYLSLRLMLLYYPLICVLEKNLSIYSARLKRGSTDVAMLLYSLLVAWKLETYSLPHNQLSESSDTGPNFWNFLLSQFIWCWKNIFEIGNTSGYFFNFQSSFKPKIGHSCTIGQRDQIGKWFGSLEIDFLEHCQLFNSGEHEILLLVCISACLWEPCGKRWWVQVPKIVLRYQLLYPIVRCKHFFVTCHWMT